ncbi:MAG: diaminopimelate epimerase [Bradymonadaceae bacterium]
MTDFYKYHGLGNDFVVVEADAGEVDPEWVRRVCDRHRGVGADGVLFVGPPDSPEADGTMVLRNRDGTRPEMCGNGIRCVVRHLVERGRVEVTDEVIVETDAGPKSCQIASAEPGNWRVAVDMGPPGFDADPVERTADGRTRVFWRVDMGNPHAVTFGTEPDEIVDQFGRAMNDRADEAFPEGVNVEFVAICGDHTAEVVVFERGVGRTRACGTGACAAAVTAWRCDHLDATCPAEIRLPGGALEIEEDERGDVWMTGPAEAVFFGEFAADWN